MTAKDLKNALLQEAVRRESWFLRFRAKGTTIKNVSLAAMRSFPIPLPPLAEQKRIIAAIEKMLPLCEKLGV